MIKQVDPLTRKNHDAQIILHPIRSNTIAFCPASRVNRCDLSVSKSRCALNRCHRTGSMESAQHLNSHGLIITRIPSMKVVVTNRFGMMAKFCKKKKKFLSSFMWKDKLHYLRFPRPWQTRARTQIFRRSFTLSSPLYLSRKSTPTIRATMQVRHDWFFFVRLLIARGSHILTNVA